MKTADSLDKAYKIISKQDYFNLLIKTLTYQLWDDGSTDYEKENGTIWPKNSFTMIGIKRLVNLEELLTDITLNNINGDIIECGVWKGGASIFIAAFIKSLDINKKLFVADSFCGLPAPDPINYPDDINQKLHTFKELAIPLEDVKTNFLLFNVLDPNVVFLPGWFKDTLPTAPIEKLCLLRLDGDMYESTIQGLENLYHKLQPGGFVIIDDFAIDVCKKAVLDFRAKNNITEEIKEIDWTGIYWQKK